MRKLTSWSLILVLLVSMLSVSALAAEDSDLVEPCVTVAYGRNIVTVKLLALEETTNGHMKVTYDKETLTLISAKVNGTVTAIDDAEAGLVEMGYADLVAFEKDDELAVLEFSYENNADTPTKTELTLQVDSFNGSEKEDETTSFFVRLKFAEADISDDDAEDEGEDESEMSRFVDVSKSDWFYDAVEYVVTNGYFNGTSDTTFSPNAPMTRAMFVTVLGRLAGVEVDHNTTAGFDDVVSGSYYAGYVKWANENGIVKGTSETTFSPNANVTREQMAAFLYRYAKFVGLDVSASDKTLNSFADADAVSAWAVDAMAWATDRGVINGTGNGLEPQASATRAQVAQIILNFQTKS